MANKLENPAYLKFVRSLPCCHCGSVMYVDAHHIIGIGMGKMGGTADDVHSMPLCRGHHKKVHDDPKSWPQTRWMIETQAKAVKAGVSFV